MKYLNKTTAVQPGFYNDISDVVSILNDSVKETTGSNDNVFLYDRVNGRTNILSSNLSNEIKEIRFSDRMSVQLGFAPNENIRNLKISQHAGNIHFGIPDQMMIYTDIIEPTFIGNEKAYVLKIVNTQPNSLTFGDACYKEFHQMHYMPLQKREFDSVSIDIRDHSGNFMPFLHGVLTLKLHFMKQDG